MNEPQMQAHRKRLLALAERLKVELSGLRDTALQSVGDAGGNLSHVPLHLGDLSNASFEQIVALGLLRNEQEVMGAVAAALDRIDAGTFGRCEQCGKDIPQERLTALPYVSLCITCAQEAEKEAGA
jgi:RNA polymerase-binding transcription factor DksA